MKKLKVCAINRDANDLIGNNNTRKKVYRNYEPTQHPFRYEREYIRALNSVKQNSLFSKPFIYAYDMHKDSIYSISTIPKNPTIIASGDACGEIRILDLSVKKCLYNKKIHKDTISGITTNPEGNLLFTCSIDKSIKIYDIKNLLEKNTQIWDIDTNEYDKNTLYISKKVKTYSSDYSYNCIDHHNSEEIYACGRTAVDIFDYNYHQPINTLQWCEEKINSIKFNRIDTNILLSSSNDCSVILYDIRTRLPIKKQVHKNSFPSICWNPIESYIFTCANCDTNLYTFDLRRQTKALFIHVGHVKDVTSIDYNPTGKEFVSGSIDRTLRIYNSNNRKSKDIYHTSRMLSIYVAKYTSDGTYILSGSHDTNIRMWRAHANERVGIETQREKDAKNYREALIRRYSNISQIHKIASHKHVPKSLLGKIRNAKEHRKAIERKISNVKSAKGQSIEEEDPFRVED